MIHEIGLHQMHNEFRKQMPKPSDYVIYCEGSKVLLRKEAENYAIPKIFEVEKICPGSSAKFHYLFSIDDSAYFSADENWALGNAGYEMTSDRAFRRFEDLTLALGGVTAAHISRWENSNRFCGHCGSLMSRSEIERAFICKKCGEVVYPKISPVVIVSVTDGDKLLMARNLNNPDLKRYLISGFVDVGESLEQAVAREVKEETGVSIRNIRYISSQPWGFSNSLIAGFTAELSGDPSIRVQQSELAEALWVSRKDIPDYDGRLSISGLMIKRFKDGTL
ncbi:MAG: NAD(+) diphosphatase [Fibrobacteraceae bacterium]|nr:NAD(+) diphosphatase [Fibrobacteraceae bacterium]